MGNRLDASIESMAQRYGNFSYSETAVAGMRHGLWVGTVRPINSVAVPDQLLDDLSNDEPVFVQGDSVTHLSGCQRTHRNHGLNLDLGKLNSTFQLEVTHNGTSAIPRCRVI